MKNMGKRVVLLLLNICLITGSVTIPTLAAEKNLLHQETLFMDGKSLRLSAFADADVGGRSTNYSKLRDLAAALDGTSAQFDVSWNQQDGAVEITTGKPYTPVGGELEPTTTSSPASFSAAKLIVDGTPVPCGAYSLDGSNYLRLRDVAAAINFAVSWDGAAGTISVDTEKPYTPTPWTPTGTTPNNLRKGGVAATDGQYIYYAAFDGIYAASMAGGEGVLLVSPQRDLGFAAFNPDYYYTGGFSFLSVAGGGLCFYFEADSDHREYSGIYRCDLTTGKTSRLVQSAKVAYVCAEGSTITYGLTENNYTVVFHRINAEGTGDHALGLTLPSGEFLVDGEWVYYVDHQYAPVAGNPMHPMYKIKLDGTGKVDLHSGYVYDWDCFLLSDGWIYYWQSSVQWQDGWSMIGGDNSVNGVWRMRTDGSGKERVYDAYSLNGRISWAQSINALDGRLYYAVENIVFHDAGNFCNTFTISSSLPGGSDTVIANIGAPNGIHFVDEICVMPGWLFYTVTRQRDDVPAANNPSVFDYDIRLCRFPLATGEPQELSRHSWDKSLEGDTITIEVPFG